MERFARLYEDLDGTTSTLAKVEAMRCYFAAAPPADAAWAVFFLSGRRFKRLVAPSLLRPWALEATGLPPWLFGDCYTAVGDLAETLALLVAEEKGPAETGLSRGAASDLSLHEWIEGRLEPLRGRAEDEQREAVLGWFAALPRHQLFILAKMLTGGLRVGVSQTLTVRALAKVSGLETSTLHHRLMGHWTPSAEFFEALLDPEIDDADNSRPYPFYLASPLAATSDLEADPEELGPLEDWQVEWKWDGIRGQLIRRSGETFLWSRGEELVTDRYPEIVAAAESLPDGTVVDGEILAWREEGAASVTDAVLPFSVLQKRIGRKKLGKKILADAPVTLLAYDVLEADGEDWRGRPLMERRARLEDLLDGVLPLSPVLEAEGWQELKELREESRERGVEGFMLKRLDSPYRTGRKKGDWWKWKIQPLTVDAVLLYAQSGHGKRATLLTDYTFGVWRGDAIVPFAKAYSGLEDAEIRELDRWLRRNTIERFGPVRSVKPEQVFEVAFEGIRRSSRHKSGIAVRFPRIHRWRRDLAPRDADTLEHVIGLLPEE